MKCNREQRANFFCYFDTPEVLFLFTLGTNFKCDFITIRWKCVKLFN